MCQLLDPEQMLSALLSWQDIKGVTPLMLAARGGHAKCLELLLRHGANPLLLDSVNNRYACTLLRLGLDDALHLVPTAGFFSSPVPCSPACILQHAQAAHACVTYSFMCRSKLACVTQSLHVCCACVLRLCVAGRSCLHYAAGAGHARCINILLNEFVCVSQPVPASQQQQQEQPQQQRLVLLPEATLKDSIRGMTRWVCMCRSMFGVTAGALQDRRCRMSGICPYT